LAGCGKVLGAATSPTPTLPPVQADQDLIVVEGVVEPVRWVTLRAKDTSAIAEVLVQEGDVVAADEVLLRLDDTVGGLVAPAAYASPFAVQQAEAALASARAQLALARAGARPEEIAALEAQLTVANAVVSQTLALLNVRRISESEADVADARAKIAAADYAYHRADEAHDDTMECFEVTRPDGKKEEICPMLGTFEEITRAQMEAAYLALLAAQSQLEAIRGKAGTQSAAASAEVQKAMAQRDAVRAQLASAKAGATAGAIAIAEAAVEQAETALATTRLLMENYEYRAPFDASVVDIAAQAGDVVPPGGELVTLATTANVTGQFRIRAKDLTELDIVHVVLGQPVVVTFDARPGVVFNGHIVRVDRQGKDYLGDVVYPVYVTLDVPPPWLKWGMTANLQICKSEDIRACASNMEELSSGDESVDAMSSDPGPVYAEAVIEPARWSELRFTTAGEVIEILVSPGTRVRAGDLIARLDAASEAARVREAEAALAQARANLASVKAGPRPEDVAAAESQVAAAEGDLARAVALRQQVTTLDRDAQVNAIQAQIAAAQAERRELEAQLRWAEEDHDGEKVQKLQEHMRVVDQRIAAAQTRLDITPRVFAAQVAVAGAGVRVAEARLAASQADLALHRAGPWAEVIAQAQASVKQAEAALATARLALARTELHAPFEGTLTQLYIEVGDVVGPERPIGVFAALDGLQARTVDLLEIDVLHISEGQPVTVEVDALSTPLQGHVAQVKPRSVLYRGDVTYPAIITLEGDTSSLMWGMKAVVAFNEVP
jgi:multidrug resistance efflux pump